MFATQSMSGSSSSMTSSTLMDTRNHNGSGMNNLVRRVRRRPDENHPNGAATTAIHENKYRHNHRRRRSRSHFRRRDYSSFFIYLGLLIFAGVAVLFVSHRNNDNSDGPTDQQDFYSSDRISHISRNDRKFIQHDGDDDANNLLDDEELYNYHHNKHHAHRLRDSGFFAHHHMDEVDAAAKDAAAAMDAAIAKERVERLRDLRLAEERRAKAAEAAQAAAFAKKKAERLKSNSNKATTNITATEEAAALRPHAADSDAAIAYAANEKKKKEQGELVRKFSLDAAVADTQAEREAMLRKMEKKRPKPSSLSAAASWSSVEVDDGEDPMLKDMPLPGGTNGETCKVYVQADISSFYREEPGSREEHAPYFSGQACKFVNMSPDSFQEFWIGHDGGRVYQGEVAPWSAGGTACFPSHKFILVRDDQEFVRFQVQKGTSVYYYDPYVKEDLDDPGHGVTQQETPRDLNTLSQRDREKYDRLRYNLEFAKAYKNFTGGSEWLTLYPKEPPRHKIWRADYFGQQHVVTTKETQFIKEPPEEKLPSLNMEEMRYDTHRLDEYRDSQTEINITLTAVSASPRIFEIPHFLSDVEVDHLLKVVHAKKLARSTTAGFVSSTRTSKTTWITRKTDPIVDAIYRRVAAALRMDEALLRRRMTDEKVPNYEDISHGINEEMQVVHYDVSEQYTSHHDFGYPKSFGNHKSRSINFCMYFNSVEKGGYTHFPRYRNAETGDGLKVKPEKGKAVIFYMVNPDGNLDDLSQHAGLPVEEGEKYFVNLWIWDPYNSDM